MIVLNKKQTYEVHLSEKILNALEKINNNPHKFLVVLDSTRKVVGTITDGDLRRAFLTGYSVHNCLSDILTELIPPLTVRYGTSQQRLNTIFSDRIKFIPLVDEHGRCVTVATKGEPTFVFGDIEVGREHPCFIIAEIGNNHNGDIKNAKALVKLAKASGANAVKFQKRDMSSLYRQKSYDQEDLGAQYTLDLLEKYQLNNQELKEVIEYSRMIGIQAFCTPFDEASVDFLESCEVQGYKVASADFSNWPLLKRIIDTGKPIIISTGMSSEDEINETFNFLNDEGASFIPLHCNSAYPAPYKDLNLKYLHILEKHTPFHVSGYSGHERGYHIPVAAVAMGARIIEKHFTDDKSKEGNDHKVSLLPDEFSTMVRQIRQLEEALGDVKPRALTQGEILNRETLGKSIIYKSDFKIGHVIRKDDIIVRSPGGGISPANLKKYIGQPLAKDVECNSLMYDADFRAVDVSSTHFEFQSPFGIPVRHHDYSKLQSIANFDFYEFHLSYSDILLDDTKFLSQNSEVDFSVHCPELFSNDHVLDLASLDNTYRRKSHEHLAATINVVKRLKTFFPKTQRPLLITNVGGWSLEDFCTVEEKKIKYRLLSDTLKNIHSEEFELIIQTMPPFPWHFGGQRYHNLFVHPDEIIEFCQENKVRICLDISHTYLACNFHSLPFYDVLESLLPITAYMHVVDGNGVDQEGLDIGKGSIDFMQIGQILNENKLQIPFIPEIWQGHKNVGEGFILALKKLQSAFCNKDLK